MDSVLENATNTFNWIEGAKLGEGAALALIETYPTLKDVLDARVSDLSKVPGIGATSAQRVRLYALEIAKESKNVIAASDTSVTAGKKLFDTKPTKRDLEVSDMPTAAVTDKQFVLVEVPVDKYYIKRTRIEATPGTCLECGFDVIMVNKLPKWDELNEFDQLQVRETLKIHVQKHHGNASGKRIITEAEMNKTNWEKPEILKP